MVFKTLQYAFVMAGMTASSAALANDGNLSPSSSSGSVSISVYIPPIGAALAASENGAVGLWSVSGRNSGLMLQLHPHTTKQGYEAISIYSRMEVGVTAEWQTQQNAGIVADGENMGGLNRTTYAVPDNSGPVQTLMIRGI